MATYGRTLRRGLPRIAGGEAWPAAGEAPDGVVAGRGDAAQVAPETASAAASPAEVTPEAASADVQVAPETASAASNAAEVTPEAVDAGVPLRRGLPRVPGGEKWPPSSVARAGTAAAVGAAAQVAPGAASAASSSVDVTPHERTPAAPVVPGATSATANTVEVTPEGVDAGAPLRRGLPRAAGGEAWPPAGTVSAPASLEQDRSAAQGAPVAAPTAANPAEVTPRAATDAEAAGAVDAPASVPVAARAEPDESDAPVAPLPFTRSAWPGVATRPEPRPEPERIGPFTKVQWAGAVVVGGAGLLVAAAMAVFFVRWLLSLGFMQDFLTTYPGEYHLPEGAPVGLPAWLGWSHFFNAFLMVLIIRSGLQIRREKRPAVFWTPKRNKKGKTSLTIWFHQSLDILWLVNGLVFLVLLFATGQWMRIVPTSWEVIPNAVSAALQYVSLDWPTENGWVNYNSLQQIAYFTTVFVAAPLAAVTGYRMSGLWPKKNKVLSERYPIEWARKVHFPTMLFFVVFIATHVFLVLSTGALRNLNHMYAATGSTDPTAYADNWTGFWMFVLSLVVIAAAWIAARPMTIAPVARLFGTVSGR